MADSFPARTKRKEFEALSDDFSDFSVSSQARKIRRLDAVFPPIFEEEEPLNLHLPDKPSEAVSIEEICSSPANEERALVLYKPMDSSLFQTPSLSGLSIEVDPEFVRGLRNQLLRHENADAGKDTTDKQRGEIDKCLAVIPWEDPNMYPSQFAEVHGASNAIPSDPMETEIAGSSMEIEEDGYLGTSSEITQSALEGSSYIGLERNSGLPQQWHQQHCMTPLLQPNAPNPLMWSW